jgi:hypothetical protein
LDSERGILDLSPEQSHRIGHEELRCVEALLGQQLLVETCRLQRDMKEGWIA